jgi:hypothetical protein
MGTGTMLMNLRAMWAIALLLAAAGDPVYKLLPPDGVPTGWQRSGTERLFIGAALYQHIDGGAELYHRNGFDRLVVQDYAEGPHEVRVEIYKMNEAAGASAVFAEMTAGLAVQTLFGTACVLDEFQILFWRGAYLVSLTTYESGAEPLAALSALAAKIDLAMTELAIQG